MDLSEVKVLLNCNLCCWPLKWLAHLPLSTFVTLAGQRNPKDMKKSTKFRTALDIFRNLYGLLSMVSTNIKKKKKKKVKYIFRLYYGIINFLFVVFSREKILNFLIFYFVQWNIYCADASKCTNIVAASQRRLQAFMWVTN